MVICLVLSLRNKDSGESSSKFSDLLESKQVSAAAEGIQAIVSAEGKQAIVSAEGIQAIVSCVLDRKTFPFSIHSLQTLDK